MGKGGSSGKDAITIASGNRMIFDHVSVSWGRDETFSISGDAQNVTVQNTIISQGLETHSCGGLMETNGGISLFRNLYVDNNTRNPKVKGVNDFQNNVSSLPSLRFAASNGNNSRSCITGAEAVVTSPVIARRPAVPTSSTTTTSLAPARASLLSLAGTRTLRPVCY